MYYLRVFWEWLTWMIWFKVSCDTAVSTHLETQTSQGMTGARKKMFLRWFVHIIVGRMLQLFPGCWEWSCFWPHGPLQSTTWYVLMIGLSGRESTCMHEMQERWVGPLGWEDPLEKGMATHSSILAWRIPWTEEPGELQSIGSQWVRHDWSD